MDLSGGLNIDRYDDFEENGAVSGVTRKKLRLDNTNNESIDSPSSSIGSDSPSSIQSPPTPMPHTPPLFSPTSSNSQGASPDCNFDTSQTQAPQQQNDLPQELLQNGWRRCWSTRERRWYFFNKLTQEARWESPANNAPNSDKRDNNRQQQHQEEQQQQQPYRKFVPSDEWNLNLASNVRMAERVPLAAFAPHPDMEIVRAQAMIKLRLCLAELCHLKEILDAPPDSVNQWIMEKKIFDDHMTSEQLLPIAGNADEISPALQRNILVSIPVRMCKLITVSDVRRLLSKYAEAAKKIVETRSVSAENRKTVKWHCESMFEWLRKSQYVAKLEEYLSRLSFLRSRCHQILTETMRPNVEFVCSRVTSHARELAANVLQEQRAKLESCNIKVPDEPLPPPRADKIVPCYSVQLRWPCVPLPEVRMEQTPDDAFISVTYKEETLRIRATHFYKLEQLYKHNCFDDRRYDCYLARVWCMLKRYDSLFTSMLAEGVKLQQSLPACVFEYLNKTFDVTFECFASPFNCYFRQYCSLFADTDGYFGSRGSFFQFAPVSGSMQMSPPFCEEVLNAAVDHAEKLLEDAQGPMSFILFLPDWRDPLLEALVKAERSRYWRCQVTFPPLEHAYRHGFQHVIYNSREIYLKSSHGTTVVVLQNEQGCSTWPADESKLTRMAEYFKQPLVSRDVRIFK